MKQQCKCLLLYMTQTSCKCRKRENVKSIALHLCLRYCVTYLICLICIDKCVVHVFLSTTKRMINFFCKLLLKQNWLVLKCQALVSRETGVGVFKCVMCSYILSFLFQIIRSISKPLWVTFQIELVS